MSKQLKKFFNLLHNVENWVKHICTHRNIWNIRDLEKDKHLL